MAVMIIIESITIITIATTKTMSHQNNNSSFCDDHDQTQS